MHSKCTWYPTRGAYTISYHAIKPLCTHPVLLHGTYNHRRDTRDTYPSDLNVDSQQQLHTIRNLEAARCYLVTDRPGICHLVIVRKEEDEQYYVNLNKPVR